LLLSLAYTPQISGSHVIVEVHGMYTVDGNGADDVSSHISISGSATPFIKRNYQLWRNILGGGTRSGTILPIIARYVSDGTSKTIGVYISTNSDDGLTVYINTTDGDTLLVRVTEIMP
jgi:hypothetical protein